MVTASGPFEQAVSMIVIGREIKVWPAGIVSVAGTVRRVGSLDARLTVRLLVSAKGMSSQPVTVPSPSVAPVGKERATAGRRQRVERVARAGVAAVNRLQIHVGRGLQYGRVAGSDPTAKRNRRGGNRHRRP